MASFCIASPSILINGDIVPIVPNSATFTPGSGKTNVRTESYGGNAVGLVIATDASSLVGVLKFKMDSTQANIDLMEAFKVLKGQLLVQIVDNGSGFTGTIADASVVNELEIAFGEAGEFDVEIHGRRADF